MTAFRNLVWFVAGLLTAAVGVILVGAAAVGDPPMDRHLVRPPRRECDIQ